MACLRALDMLIKSEEAVSVACDPMFVGIVRLDVVVGFEIEVKLEVGAKVNEAIGSYDRTAVEEDETVVEVLDVVGMFNEKSGESPVESAGSEVNVSDVVDGAEEDDSDVVEGAVVDVSNGEDIVVESETVLDVAVDIGAFSADDAGTEDSAPLPVAPLELSGSCPEIAASSP